MAKTARKAAPKRGAKKPAKKTAHKATAKKATTKQPADETAKSAVPGKGDKPDDPFGDHAWLSAQRSKGRAAPAMEAYVLPESREEAVTGLKVGELESMISGAVTLALEDKRRGAPKGNRFWEARSSHGRKPKFAKASELEDACMQYFEWVEEHPLHEEVLVTHMGDVFHDTKTKMRAMTLEGLCLFIGIAPQTWREWRGSPATPTNPAAPGRKDLSAVMEWVENVIRTQKFEGAAAGFLNANIISRDLGLADRSAATMEAGDTLAQFLTTIAQAPLFGRGA